MVSEHAAGRVEQVDIDYLRVRVSALASLAGNPYGAAVHPAGDGWAFLAAERPSPLFNHVMGLTADPAAPDGPGAPDGPRAPGASGPGPAVDLARVLAELAGWYASHHLPLRADVTPAQASPALFTALTAQGLSQTGFYAGLYAESASLDPAAGQRQQPEAILVEAAGREEFAQTYAAGFGFPAARRPGMAVSVQVLAGRTDTSCYRARIGSQTAGIGLLFRAGGTGYPAGPSVASPAATTAAVISLRVPIRISFPPR